MAKPSDGLVGTPQSIDRGPVDPEACRYIKRMMPEPRGGGELSLRKVQAKATAGVPRHEKESLASCVKPSWLSLCSRLHGWVGLDGSKVLKATS